MAPAQSSSSSKPRVASPSARATKDVSNTQISARSKAAQKRSALWQLYCLLFNIDCIMGGEMLNIVEKVIVYVVLLGLLALVAWGSYMQLSKLVLALLPQPSA